jgi:tripartite-type tricarboxylate transporter receptor subunit TctC
MLALSAVGLPAVAQYPAKPVKLIVPFPPGGPTDVVGRVIAQQLTQTLGQPVVVENRAGASGTMGVEAAAKSPPDGYTLALGTTGTLASAPGLYANLGYDPLKSFSPISLLIRAPFLVVVHASVPAASLRELIEFAKSKPGQLHFGSGGNGHPLHIAGEMFKDAAGVELVHVPYKGTGPVVVDLLAGRTQIIFEQPAALLAHIRGGKLRALAVAAGQRISQLPDVPTASEAGLPGYEVSVWFGLVAPRGIPAEVTKRLNAEVLKALATKEVRDIFAAQALEPLGSSPEEFSAHIAAEAEKWSRTIRASGVKPD